MADPVQAQIPAHGEVPENGEYISSAFPLILHALDIEQKNCVLDLGSPSIETFRTYQRYFQKIIVEDLDDEIRRLEEPSEAGESYLQAVTERLLSYAKDTKFDVIICWDILNYLTIYDVAELVVHLAKYCHQDTLLYGLISTYRSMPASPLRFRIHDDNRITFGRTGPGSRLSPRYSPNQLRKLFPRFRAEQVSLLRCGYYELLMSMTIGGADDH